MESRIPSTLEEEVASLSRSADRDSLFMQANLLFRGQSRPVTVRVRNLSAGGMLAEAVGATANVGIAERAERLIVTGVAVLLAGLGVPYVLPVVLWILGGLGLVTIGQRIWAVRGQLRVPPTR